MLLIQSWDTISIECRSSADTQLQLLLQFMLMLATRTYVVIMTVMHDVKQALLLLLLLLPLLPPLYTAVILRMYAHTVCTVYLMQLCWPLYSKI